MSNGQAQIPKNHITGSFNFGGFYYSWHSDYLEELVKNYFTSEDEDGNEYLRDKDYWKKVNYDFLRDEYSKRLLDLINDKLKNDGIDISFNYIELLSPKDYNYATDWMMVFVKSDKLKRLFAEMLKDEEFIAHIKAVTTPVSGYAPYNQFSDFVGYDQNNSPIPSKELPLRKVINLISGYWDAINYFEYLGSRIDFLNSMPESKFLIKEEK